MISLPKDIHPNDVVQWLDGGYFYARINGEMVVVCLAGPALQSESGVMSWPVNDSRANTYQVVKEDMFPHWPMCGSINIEDRSAAAWIERLQKKQWCRTFRPSSIAISWPGVQVTPIHNGDRIVADALFTPKYYTLDAALEMMQGDSGWQSVALTRTVIVSNTTPNSVYFMGQFAGQLVTEKFGRRLIVKDRDLAPRLLKAMGGGVYL